MSAVVALAIFGRSTRASLAIVVDLVVAVGLPNALVVGMIAGTMDLADATVAVRTIGVWIHGIADSSYSVDDDSNAILTIRVAMIATTLSIPNGAMELGWVLVAVHDILVRWAMENSNAAHSMGIVDLVVPK